MNDRWSDEKLDVFHHEFQDFTAKFDAHIGDESYEQRQQQELYAAVFQKADPDTNTPPGLLQMVTQVSRQMHSLQIWQDRQKTFIGGAFFAISALWFFLTEVGHKLLQIFGLFK
jgi:hypothetical protein